MISQEIDLRKAFKENDTIRYTDSSAVTVGDCLYVDGIGALRAVDTYGASEEGVYQIKGLARVSLATGENPQQGTKVYWDVSAGEARAAGSSSLVSGDFLLGVAASDASASGGYVEVNLNEVAADEDGFKAVAATATLTLKDKNILVSGASGAVVLTVPAAASANDGHEYMIKATNLTNSVTTATGFVHTFSVVGETILIRSDGTAWREVVNYKPSVTASGITSGQVAAKTIASAELEALLDTSTNNLFSVKSGDVILEVRIAVGTAAGAACTVDIGTDADVDGSAADVDSLLAAADANAAENYTSYSPTYAGADSVKGHFISQGDGYVTIKSSTDQSGSAFVGTATMFYIPA